MERVESYILLILKGKQFFWNLIFLGQEMKTCSSGQGRGVSVKIRGGFSLGLGLDGVDENGVNKGKFC